MLRSACSRWLGTVATAWAFLATPTAAHAADKTQITSAAVCDMLLNQSLEAITAYWHATCDSSGAKVNVVTGNEAKICAVYEPTSEEVDVPYWVWEGAGKTRKLSKKTHKMSRFKFLGTSAEKIACGECAEDKDSPQKRSPCSAKMESYFKVDLRTVESFSNMTSKVEQALTLEANMSAAIGSYKLEVKKDTTSSEPVITSIEAVPEKRLIVDAKIHKLAKEPATYKKDDSLYWAASGWPVNTYVYAGSEVKLNEAAREHFELSFGGKIWCDKASKDLNAVALAERVNTDKRVFDCGPKPKQD